MRIHTTILRLLIAVAPIAACGSRPNSGQAATAQTTPALFPDAQLADYVVGAFVDSKGELWFGTMGNGVAHVRNGTLSFIDTTQGLPPNGGHSIVEAKNGLMWFAGHDGVYTYDRNTGGPVSQVKASEARVATDRAGHVWVSTMGRVFRYEGDSATEFMVPTPEEPPASFSISPRSLVFMLEDTKGNLWFRTDGHGAFRYDPSVALNGDGQPFTQFTKKDGLCSNTPWDIIEDREGRIWFACIQAFRPKETGDGGLCVLEPDGSIRSFPDVAGLHHTDIYTLYVDRDGSLWSSAFRTGVYRIDAAGFTLYNSTDRPDLNGNFGLQAMVQDRNGTRWCGFSGGLFRVVGNGFVNVPRGGPWW